MPSVPTHDPPVSTVPKEPAPQATWIVRAGTLIDGTGREPSSAFELLVENGVVTEVAEKVAAPPGTEVLDLHGYTVTPGLIDCHTHLTLLLGPDFVIQQVQETEADEALRGVESARKTLEAGFTTVRNVGGFSYADVALRRAIDDGRIVGPRVVPAGYFISVLGGHGDRNGFRPGVLESEPSWKHGIVSSPSDCRAAVRHAVKHGVEVIKIMSTGGVLSRGDAVTARQFSDEEIRAIVDEAGHAGLRVASHAHGTAGIRSAVEGGVASVEHGTYLDEDTLGLMKSNGTYLVPTRMAGETILEQAESGELLEWAKEKAYEVAPRMRASFESAVREGVAIAFGTDSGVFAHGLNAREFQLLVEGGMTPMQAILSATREAANLIGRSDIGVLESGRLADLVAYSGDPLENIKVLEEPVLVMKGGRIFVDRRQGEISQR